MINVAEDRIYPSNNPFDIPTLQLSLQPKGGLLLPCAQWGESRRIRKNIATWMFYVDDYRFNRLWLHPAQIPETGCSEAVEPNFSVFDTTPIAYGLQQIYKKRWIARFWQECGLRIYADLNVSLKFREYNRMGIPDGYNGFATRGNGDRLDCLKDEIQTAREISGCDTPNMIVYGGGAHVRDICLQSNLVYVPDTRAALRQEQQEREAKRG